MARMTGVFSLALSALVTPALADITPSQAWGNYKSLLVDMGMTVTGTEELVGDTLTVRDAAFGLELMDGQSSTTGQYGTLVFEGQPDGSVKLVLKDRIAVIGNVRGNDEAMTVGADIIVDGIEVVISGSPEDTLYAISGPSMRIELTHFDVDGEVLTPDTLKFSAIGSNLTGQARLQTTADQILFERATSMDSLTYSLEAFAPAGSGGDRENLIITGSAQEVSVAGDGGVPRGAGAEGFASVLNSGLSSSAALSHKGSEVEVSTLDGDGTSVLRLGSASGALNVDVTTDHVQYLAAGAHARAEALFPGAPLPMGVSMAEYSTEISVPMQPGGAPQDMTVKLDLAGVEVGDALMNGFDPDGVLPRDPGQVTLDMVAKISPLVNLLDPRSAAWVASEGTSPVLFEALDLKSLLIRALGAEVAARAGFVFDNANLEQTGFPVPSGTINVDFNGVNGLLDKLVALGFLDETKAAGARFGLSQFTLPGRGEDELNSAIEIESSGRIFVNGTRIQ